MTRGGLTAEMLERKIEQRLNALEKYGFQVIKVKLPGYNGAMDRLILRPKYSPGPPSLVELKRPGKVERKLQAVVRDDWRARGVIVHDMCDTIEKVDALVLMLINSAPRFATERAANISTRSDRHGPILSVGVSLNTENLPLELGEQMIEQMMSEWRERLLREFRQAHG